MPTERDGRPYSYREAVLLEGRNLKQTRSMVRLPLRPLLPRQSKDSAIASTTSPATSAIDHPPLACWAGNAVGNVTLQSYLLETSASNRDRHRPLQSRKFIYYPNAVMACTCRHNAVVVLTRHELEAHCIQLPSVEPTNPPDHINNNADDDDEQSFPIQHGMTTASISTTTAAINNSNPCCGLAT
jgi:hypothetical protein